MLYAIIAVALLAAFGGYTAYEQHLAATNATAKLLAQQADAEAKIAAKDKALVDAANDQIASNLASYQAGQAHAKVITRRIYVKGQANVASDKGLSNPQCVMSDDSLQLLRSALANLHAPVDPGGVPATVPGAGATGSSNVQRPIPQLPQEHRAVGGVRAPARPTDSPHQVPGTGTTVPPKPKPITG